jgi:hydrogenase nickel incorporation protein HypA/HybF
VTGAARVLSVRLRIGEFSGVEADLLASAYTQLVDDTPLRESQLEIARTPLVAVCGACGNESRIERFQFQCRNCGSRALSICGGEEMILAAVTLEAAET